MTFPGGSKKRVTKAGDNIRKNKATSDDLDVIEMWRAAHRNVLNTFQAILRNRTRGKKILVAQRHKRRNTIFDKMQRLPKMELARMDDIAGCRLIFKDIKQLYSFRQNFHKANFKHKRKNDENKYDYIKRPKVTGYRGVHDVYSYDVNSEVGRPLKGLMVEIQYRTQVQHAWATAIEVVGFVTKSQPKFQQGDKRYEECMSYASELLSRYHEEKKGPHPELSNAETIKRFEDLDQELHLIKTLAGLNTARNKSTSGKNMILIFKSGGELDIHSYKDATEAVNALFDFEKKNPELDVVLVKADTREEIRTAFQNYFSDAKDFVRLLNEARRGLD